MKRSSLQDQRSHKFVFVPFCLLAQAYQAQGIVKHKYGGAISPIVQIFLDNKVNIIQMPCFEAFYLGLIRKPMGYTKYNTGRFKKLCDEEARRIAEQIQSLIKNNYEVIGILGMEYSPACATSFIYTNEGTVHKKGIFMERLDKLLKEENIDIPFVGINRRGIKASMLRVQKLL